MTITRNINGVNVGIELTETELYDAYKEQEHIYDMEDVRQYWEYPDMDKDGRTRLTDEQISEIAYLSREYQNNADSIMDTLWECVDDAIKDYARENGIKPYEEV